MKLKLIRKEMYDNSTIGELYIDNKFFCYTLEDKDRGLNQSMSLEEITKKKVYGQTAIPSGNYSITLNKSPKFKRILPRLLGVKGYEGVLIHRGNTDKDTLGCILVGKQKGNNTILQSTAAEEELVSILTEYIQTEKEAGRVSNITLEIVYNKVQVQ